MTDRSSYESYYMTSKIEFCLETVLWSSLISFSLKLYLKVYNIRIYFYSISWEPRTRDGPVQCPYRTRGRCPEKPFSANLSCKGVFSSYIIGNVIYTIINMEHYNSKNISIFNHRTIFTRKLFDMDSFWCQHFWCHHFHLKNCLFVRKWACKQSFFCN